MERRSIASIGQHPGVVAAADRALPSGWPADDPQFEGARANAELVDSDRGTPAKMETHLGILLSVKPVGFWTRTALLCSESTAEDLHLHMTSREHRGNVLDVSCLLNVWCTISWIIPCTNHGEILCPFLPIFSPPYTESSCCAHGRS